MADVCTSRDETGADRGPRGRRMESSEEILWHPKGSPTYLFQQDGRVERAVEQVLHSLRFDPAVRAEIASRHLLVIRHVGIEAWVRPHLVRLGN